MDQVRTQRGSIVWGLGFAVLLMASLAISTAAEDVTLNFMHCWDAHRTEWVNEMLASFEAAHPGIKVQPQLVSCGLLSDSFITSYLGGAAPDIVMIHSLDIPRLVDMGMFISVDTYRARDGISLDTWYPSEIGTAVWKGALYGFPIRTGGDVNAIFYYNRTHFSEAGLDPDRPPTTWDEWLNVSRRLTLYQDDRLVRAGSALYGGDFSEVAYLATAGGRLISEDGRHVVFADEAGLSAIEFARDLGMGTYRGSWPDYGDFTSGDDTGAFIRGQLAMHTGGILSYSYYKTNAPDLDFGLGVRPSRVSDGTSGANAGTFHWSIVQGTAHPEAAWELLKWISLREDTGGLFMLRQGRPSPVAAFNQNPAYFETNPYWFVVGEALQRVMALPQYPFTREVMNRFGGALGGVAWGSEAPRAALDRAASEAQALMDEYWKGQ